MGSCLLYCWLVGALVFTDKCTDGISYNNKQFSSIKNVIRNKKKTDIRFPIRFKPGTRIPCTRFKPGRIRNRILSIRKTGYPIFRNRVDLISGFEHPYL